MRIINAAAMAAIALSLGGCVSSSGQEPAWFAERVAEESDSYPDLREVPRTTIANTDQAHWAAVESDLMAAAAELRSNPRAQYTQPEDPAAFADQARRDLDAARRSHEPAGQAQEPSQAQPAPPPGQ